ncbi:hypothetical protein GCM10027440_04870 [Nocardiopsis coralliicola]
MPSWPTSSEISSIPTRFGGNPTPQYGTDVGQWGSGAAHDRAVGLNQHLRSGWEQFGADGNGDGTANPRNCDTAYCRAWLPHASRHGPTRPWGRTSWGHRLS